MPIIKNLFDGRLFRKFKLIGKWFLKFTFSIADQGIVTATNFIVNIFLIRSLTPEMYGAYSIAFSIFLFFSGFFTAIILEPMLVLGPGKFGTRSSGYSRTILNFYFIVSLVLSILLFITSFVLMFLNKVLSLQVFSFGIMISFYLFYQLQRHICYLKSRPDIAVRGSFLYSLVLSLGVLFLKRKGIISSGNVILNMAIAGFFAAILIKLTSDKDKYNGNEKILFSEVLKEHWSYGKWIIGASIIYWVGNTFYFPLIGMFDGLPQAGAFKAMQNLFMPLQQGFIAIGYLLLPWLAKERHNRGYKVFKKDLLKIFIFNITISGLYYMLIVLGKTKLIGLLYGNSFYWRYEWLLYFIGLTVIINILNQSIALGMKALQHPDSVLWARLSGAVITLTLSIFLVWKYKLAGAVLGLGITTITWTVVMGIFFIHYMRVEKQKDAEDGFI